MEQVLQVRWKLPSPPAKACMLRNLAYVRLALVSCFDCTGVYDEQYSMAVLFYMNVHPSFCKLLSLSTELDCPSFLEPPYRVSPCEHSSVPVFPAWRPFRLFSFRWYFTQCCSFVEYIHVGSAFLGTAKLLCKVAVEIYTLASSAWAFLLAFILCLGFVTRFEFCSSRSSSGGFHFHFSGGRRGWACARLGRLTIHPGVILPALFAPSFDIFTSACLSFIIVLCIFWM